MLGQKISFTSIDELNSLLEVLNNCQSICSIESNYDLPEGYKYYMKAKVENASYSSEAPDTIAPLTVYTHKEYTDIKEQLKENAKVMKTLAMEHYQWKTIANQYYNFFRKEVKSNK